MSKHRKRGEPDFSLECPNCHSKDVRYLRKSNSIYCRRCGTEWGADWVDPPKPKGGERK